MPMFLTLAQDETDALFRTDPLALAERFGDRARRLMAEGRDPFVSARIAATYAFMHRPDLRGERPVSPWGQKVFAIGNELNAIFADALKKPTVH